MPTHFGLTSLVAAALVAVCAGECFDTDVGKSDKDRQMCWWYKAEATRCQQADARMDSNFNATKLCCACGGGSDKRPAFGERVPLEFMKKVEWLFQTAAHNSARLAILVGCITACGAVGFLPLWLIVRVSSKCRCLRWLPKPLYCLIKNLTPWGTAFFGLIYFMYIVTIPAFGRPRVPEELRTDSDEQGDKSKRLQSAVGSAAAEGGAADHKANTQTGKAKVIKASCCRKDHLMKVWLTPGFPHYGSTFLDEEMDNLTFEKLMGIVAHFLFNGVSIMLLPYMVILMVFFVCAMLIIVPCVLVIMTVLAVIARVADSVAKIALEGTMDSDDGIEKRRKRNPRFRIPSSRSSGRAASCVRV